MAPQVQFFRDESNFRTMMEVVTADRPGLLSRIGWALVDSDVSLQNANIATFGERVERHVLRYGCSRTAVNQ